MDRSLHLRGGSRDQCLRHRQKISRRWGYLGFKPRYAIAYLTRQGILS